MLHRADLLDVSVIHGDGTTTAAKKGGDDIGFSGHKKVKGDKVVAFCDRNCNVIAPFISARGNYNESPLLRDALSVVTRIADSIGVDLRGTIVSLDGVYDCRRNRKAIFNRGMKICQTSTQIPEVEKIGETRTHKLFFDAAIIKIPAASCGIVVERKQIRRTQRAAGYSRSGSIPLSVWLVGRISSAACCSGSNPSASYIMALRRWHMQ